MKNEEIFKSIIDLLQKEINWAINNKNMVSDDEYKGYITGIKNSIYIIEQLQDNIEQF